MNITVLKATLVITLSLTMSMQAWSLEEDTLNANNEEVLLVADYMPEFPGGDDALMQFIQENININYTKTTIKECVEGRIIIRLVVEKDGQVGEIGIVTSSTNSIALNKEAIRVCKMLPKFNPGRNAAGDPVRVWYTLPVTFNIPDEIVRQYVEQLREDAQLGDVLAQYKLGHRYWCGDGVPQDYGKAIYWLQKAELQGDDEALSMLPLVCALNANYDEAHKYYKETHPASESVNTGDMLYDLAQEVDNRKLNYRISKMGMKTELLSRAEEMGHAQAMWDLACYYADEARTARLLQDEVEERDNEINSYENRALEHFMQYLKATNASTQSATIADVYYSIASKMGDYDYKKMEYIEMAAHLGNADAIVTLGNYYFYDGHKDYEKASRYYEEAAKNGNAQACYNLGWLNINAFADSVTGVGYIEKAALLGDAQAQYVLGNFFASGFVVEQNLKKAHQWYKKASKQGQEDAAMALALLAEVGGSKADAETFITLLEAERGDVKAQIATGDCYYYGNGVKQDIDKAIEWYKRAASSSNTTALYSLVGTYAHLGDYQNAMLLADKFYFPGTGNDPGALLCAIADMIYPNKKYLDFLKDAVDLGNEHAMNDLACIYALNGDDKSAVDLLQHYYDLINEKNNRPKEKVTIADVYYIIGHHYNDMVSKQRQADKEHWIVKAAHAGCYEAQDELVRYYEENKDYANAMVWLQQLAGRGDAYALAAMGAYYEEGKGVAKSHYQAIECYKKAASLGHPYAQNFIGECILKGEIPGQVPQNAKELFEKAIKNNANFRFKKPWYNLGLCYYQGLGVEQDFKKAVENFELCCYVSDQINELYLPDLAMISDYTLVFPPLSSVEDDSVDEQQVALLRQQALEGFDGTSDDWYLMGLYYLKTGNTQEAVNWLTKAAEECDRKAQAKLVYHFVENREYDKALEWFKKICHYNTDDLSVSTMLYCIDCSNNSHDRYIAHLHQAAKNGDQESLVTLACLYAMGEDVKQDSNMAVDYYKKYLETTGKPSQDVTIAHVYYEIKNSKCLIVCAKRHGLEQNWLEKAAQEGHAQAQYEMGRHYENDDFDKAAFWYLKAAGQGHVDAQYSLASLYQNSERYGRPKDDVKALEWYKKAASQGHAQAQHMVAEYYSTGKARETNPGLASEYYQKAATSFKAQAEKCLEEPIND